MTTGIDNIKILLYNKNILFQRFIYSLSYSTKQ